MVLIDKEKCTGCGACTAVCENVFEMKNGKASVKAGKKSSKEACVKEAADSCPVQAIKL